MRGARVLLCLAVTIPAFAADDAETTFGERVDRAVTQGSVPKLRALHPQADVYDAAYLDWRIVTLLPDGAKKEKKKLLTKIEQRLDDMLKKDPTNAEVHALHGTVIGGQITGMWSGMKLGKKSSAALERAFELAPDNPRVALQRGISFFWTPKSFGGGLDKALAEFRRARDLFVKEPAEKSWPNWGRVDALMWLGQAQAKAGNTDQARSTYQAALELEPEHRWINEVLLPELDGKKRRN